MKRSDVRNLVNAVTTAKAEPEPVVEPVIEPVAPEFSKSVCAVVAEPVVEPVVEPEPVTPNLTGISAEAAYNTWLLGSQGMKLRHLGGVDMVRLHHAYADRVSAIFRAGFEAGSA